MGRPELRHFGVRSGRRHGSGCRYGADWPDALANEAELQPVNPKAVAMVDALHDWSFYAAGVFNEKNPWWLVMPDITKYLQRVSYILRQGTPANDVALFLPNNDAWASFGRNFSMSSALQGKVSGLVQAITDSGYNLDFFDDQLLEMRGKVAGNTLAFGDVHYRVVVLPGVERILPD